MLVLDVSLLWRPPGDRARGRPFIELLCQGKSNDDRQQARIYRQGPRRDRQLRRHRGGRRQILGRAGAALARQFQDRLGEAAQVDRARARHRQARRRRSQHGARPARPEARQGHRRRRAGGDRRQARRALPAGRVADGLRHAVQHERQRGDLEPGDRDAGRRDGLQEAGASQRPRQHEPVVERHLSDGHAHRLRGGDPPPPAAGAAPSAQGARRQGEGVGAHHQDRPHAHAGCDAAHAGPGVLRLRHAGGERHQAHRIDAAGPDAAGARRHRRRHRPQRARKASPRRSPRASPRSPACPSPARPTSSRRWPRTTPW